MAAMLRAIVAAVLSVVVSAGVPHLPSVGNSVFTFVGNSSTGKAPAAQQMAATDRLFSHTLTIPFALLCLFLAVSFFPFFPSLYLSSVALVSLSSHSSGICFRLLYVSLASMSVLCVPLFLCNFLSSLWPSLCLVIMTWSYLSLWSTASLTLSVSLFFSAVKTRGLHGTGLALRTLAFLAIPTQLLLHMLTALVYVGWLVKSGNGDVESDLDTPSGF